MTTWYVEIVAYDEKDGPAHKLGPYESERQAERADDGANINLDHERFYTRIVERKPAARFTRHELDAMRYALSTMLAAPELDGIDGDSEEEAAMLKAIKSAREKVQVRLERAR